MTNKSRLSDQLFKKLTRKNWRKRDTTSEPFVNMRNGKSRTMGVDAWAASILKVGLSENVPKDVRNLFEVAQGAMCYGSLFYPLFTLGIEQLHRVLEAAIKHKWKALGTPSNARSFYKRLAWLRDNGHITEKRFRQWNAGRERRNSTSHADRQTLLTPIDSLMTLDVTAELIEELFQDTPAAI